MGDSFSKPSETEYKNSRSINIIYSIIINSQFSRISPILEGNLIKLLK